MNLENYSVEAIEKFLSDYNVIIEKAEQIARLTYLHDRGEDLDGYQIDELGITIKSNTHFSGCGYDYYEANMSWQDLHTPMAEHEAENEKRRLAKEEEERLKPIRQAQEKERKEKELLKQLKDKYE